MTRPALRSALATGRARRERSPSPQGSGRGGDEPAARGRPRAGCEQELGHPRNELDLLRALITSKTKRYAEAKPTLRQAFVQQRTPDRQVDEALAKAYLETYDLTRAMMVLDRWARDFPDDPKPFLWRAEVHSRTNESVGAVEDDYREALRRDPSLARARPWPGRRAAQANRSAEAAVEYDAYLALEPDDAVAHLGAGRNRMEQGDEAAATAHLERAMALDGENAEPLKEMADAATRRGDWVETLNLLDRAIALDPYDVTLRYSRGLARDARWGVPMTRTPSRPWRLA